MKKVKSSAELEQFRKDILDTKDSDKSRVIISTKAACCYLKGSKEVAETFQKEIKNQNLEEKVELVTTGCLGFCQEERFLRTWSTQIQ